MAKKKRVISRANGKRSDFTNKITKRAISQTNGKMAKGVEKGTGQELEYGTHAGTKPTDIVIGIAEKHFLQILWRRNTQPTFQLTNSPTNQPIKSQPQ